MAIQAEQFPVAAVGRIVVMVVVFVMNRQLMQFLAGKLPPAPGANPRQYFQRSIAVNIAAPLAILARAGQDLLQRVIATRCFRRWHKPLRVLII
jgi:uncharacterized membrane protein